MKTAGHSLRTTRAERVFYRINYVFVTLFILLMLYPCWLSFVSSISNPTKLMAFDGLLIWPLGFSLDAYASVFKNPNIINGFRNTLEVVGVAVPTNLVLTLIAAYALSRKNFLYRTPLTIFIVLTMFVSGGMIPIYLTVYTLGLTNTLWSMILPTLMDTYNLLITRNYLSSIPDSIEESARMDGAGHVTILSRILVPMIIPIIAVNLLFYAVFKWNGWFYPMLFLNKRELFPLQLILREILIMNDTTSMVSSVSVIDKEPIAITIQYATMMVSIIPIMLVYPFLQKYFVKGLTAGAIKE